MHSKNKFQITTWYSDYKKAKAEVVILLLEEPVFVVFISCHSEIHKIYPCRCYQCHWPERSKDTRLPQDTKAGYLYLPMSMRIKHIAIHHN